MYQKILSHITTRPRKRKGARIGTDFRRIGIRRHHTYYDIIIRDRGIGNTRRPNGVRRMRSQIQHHTFWTFIIGIINRRHDNRGRNLIGRDHHTPGKRLIIRPIRCRASDPIQNG